MASIWVSKQLWRAVIITVVIHFIYEAASNHIYKDVFAEFSNFVEATDGEGFKEDSKPDFDSFSKQNLKSQLRYALLLPLKYWWQVWLEKKFPSRPRPNLEFKEKSMNDVNEALEEEIMRRLIAKGKVQRASLRWGNILVKLLVDLIGGSIIFGALWIPVRMMTNLEFGELGKLADLHWDLLDVIVFGEAVTRLTSGWLFFQFLNFIIVPVEWRLPSLASMQLIVNVFVGSFLKLLLPWIQAQEGFQEGLKIAEERRKFEEAFRNSTMKSNITAATNDTSAAATAVLPVASEIEHLEA